MDKNSSEKKQSILTRRIETGGLGSATAALVFLSGSKFIERFANEARMGATLSVFIMVFVAGFSCSRVKKKFGFIKNNIIRSIVVVVLLYCISMLVAIPLLTVLLTYVFIALFN